VNAHCATKEAAVASLQLFVDLVMHDDRLRLSRLRCVPVCFGLIELGR
jgi:hypothetical protein